MSFFLYLDLEGSETAQRHLKPEWRESSSCEGEQVPPPCSQSQRRKPREGGRSVHVYSTPLCTGGNTRQSDRNVPVQSSLSGLDTDVCTNMSWSTDSPVRGQTETVDTSNFQVPVNNYCAHYNSPTINIHFLRLPLRRLSTRSLGVAKLQLTQQSKSFCIWSI